LSPTPRRSRAWRRWPARPTASTPESDEWQVHHRAEPAFGAENMPLARMMPCEHADEVSQRWTYSAATGESKTHDG
jgi:hypothetical protein